MVPAIFIYDNDVKVRQKIVSAFDNRAETKEVFSPEMLTLFVKRAINSGERPSIICRQSLEMVLREQISELDCDLYVVSDGLDNLLAVSETLANRRMSNNAVIRDGDYFDLLCIGSSTGGYPVVADILDNIRPTRSIVIICQHVSEGMSAPLADSLSQRSLKPVNIVKDLVQLQSGCVYLLQGGSDYIVRQRGRNFIAQKHTGDSTGVFHPSIDILAKSLVQIDSARIGYVILSGLGNDGSAHASDLAKRGVKILTQDPKTAIAKGMPESLIKTLEPTVMIRKTDDLINILKQQVA
jgi:chemotaxis response regulator CheB